PLIDAAGTAMDAAWFLDDRRAAARLDSAVRTHPLDKIDALERPYAALVRAYALAGRVDRAQAALAGFDSSRARVARLGDASLRHTMMGDLAMATNRYTDAIREYRAADAGRCVVCRLPDIARAYDLAGNADSARAVLA